MKLPVLMASYSSAFTPALRLHLLALTDCFLFRRSTRIVDMENREKAEKIMQENRQKEQEAKAALQKQKEEEPKMKGTSVQKEESDSSMTTKKKKQPRVCMLSCCDFWQPIHWLVCFQVYISH